MKKILSKRQFLKLQSQKLSPNHNAVLMIALMMMDKNGIFIPDYGYIASLAELSIRTTKSILKKIEELNVIRGLRKESEITFFQFVDIFGAVEEINPQTGKKYPKGYYQISTNEIIGLLSTKSNIDVASYAFFMSMSGDKKERDKKKKFKKKPRFKGFTYRSHNYHGKVFAKRSKSNRGSKSAGKESIRKKIGILKKHHGLIVIPTDEPWKKIVFFNAQCSKEEQRRFKKKSYDYVKNKAEKLKFGFLERKRGWKAKIKAFKKVIKLSLLLGFKKRKTKFSSTKFLVESSLFESFLGEVKYFDLAIRQGMKIDLSYILTEYG